MFFERKKPEERAAYAVKLARKYAEKAGKSKNLKDKNYWLSEAIKILSKEIEKNPNQLVLYYARGQLLVVAEEYKLAKKDLTKVLMDKSFLDKAGRHASSVLRDIHENLTKVEFSLRNYDEAAIHLLKVWIGQETANELISDPELIHFAKGMLFYGHEEYRNAVKELIKVLEIDPKLENKHLLTIGSTDKEKFFFILGFCEIMSGDLENAKKHLEKVLELNPSNKDAKTFLTSLQTRLKKSK